MTTKNNKVLLGMSGGIDSSSAAIMLQDKGYEVIGTTFVQHRFEEMASSINDAKQVAHQLGIEHFVMDIRDLFKQEVIAYFHKEYERGRTPNPCVKCNQVIKYQHFIKEADKRGIYHIASGQYAKVVKTSAGYQIHKATNKKKDQSYYLYQLKEKDLPRLLLPLGDIADKENARQLLKDRGIALYHKQESQEICFIKDDQYIPFIEQYFDPKSKVGNFVDSSGKVLGSHKGIHRYTIGQRKGLGIALGTPHYVVDINSETNEITLSDQMALQHQSCLLTNSNLIDEQINLTNETFQCKIRYTSKELPATLAWEGNELKVTFLEPIRALTPGQSLVCYQGDRLIGGGMIDKRG